MSAPRDDPHGYLAVENRRQLLADLFGETAAARIFGEPPPAPAVPAVYGPHCSHDECGFRGPCGETGLIEHCCRFLGGARGVPLRQAVAAQHEPWASRAELIELAAQLREAKAAGA